jgi:ribosomal protein S18 acetylase RimI-like enzyme
VNDPVALCVDAVAAWHASWLAALGIRSERDDAVWRTLEAPPNIYFAAITLRPEAEATAVVSAPGSICDSWQALELEPLRFRVWRRDPWYHRPASSVYGTEPPELNVIRVTTEAELAELEEVSVRGFGGEGARVEPGSLHPPTILDDPRMALFLGRVDGRPVSASMGYRTDDAVGVFGVTTIASARRRGYGTALTRAAMLPETGLPVVLASSEEGEQLYRGLGFHRVGELSIWVREDPVP